jgi:vancomycin resistance protein YoaR
LTENISSPRTRLALALALARRRWGVTLGALASAVLLSAFIADELLGSGLPRGARLWGQNLSHVSVEHAQRQLEPRAKELAAAALSVEIDGKRAPLSFAKAGLQIDWSNTLQRAIAARRNRNVAARFVAWAASVVRTSPELVPSFVVDEARLARELDALEAAFVALPFAGGFKFEQGAIAPDYPRPGRRLDRSAARRELEEAFARGATTAKLSTAAVAAPYEPAVIERLVTGARTMAAAGVLLEDAALGRKLTLLPDELLAALRIELPSGDGSRPALGLDGALLLQRLGERRAALENDAKPARFEIDAQDHVQILPSEPERRLDPESLASAVMSATVRPERRGPLPLAAVAEPALTTEQAKALGIRGLVSTFTTRHPCCERRVENIHRIADLLDGLLVKPGETASVNAIIGPRTAKNGFVPAPTIEEGEMVETLGGGISQFATTLFNALFHGGYDIIERQPHTYWFPRYPMGHEATLSYPKPDVIFRNDTEAGMLFDTRYTKTSITVRIFGDNGGRRVEAQVSPRKNIVEPPLEILANPAIPPDKEHVTQSGMIGWSVTVARIIHLPDGTKREERRKVTYKPKARRVEVHPCRVPKGERGYTGEPCPEPEASEPETSDHESPASPPTQ